ncbi:MAG: L-seryl-tRNA(Sec) selenium transferase [Thermodesulfobacteriota bacterium]
MKIDAKQQAFLKMLPGIDHLLEAAESEPALKGVPRPVLIRCGRETVESLRSSILKEDPEVDAEALSEAAVLKRFAERVGRETTLNLRPVVNGTGVVIHTNLGRSPLAPEAVENIVRISNRYSNLEFDLSQGKRGSRYDAIEDILCEITGAEAAMAVNNNAGAVLLCLNTLAEGREVIVSRGELVEIGGSFRIPDVMSRSGAVLKEVGSTNRTHLRDYEAAVNETTGLLLKVHQSNYSIVGFTRSVSVSELTELGRRRGLPVMEDLGSGTLVDFSRYGMIREPTVMDSVSAGPDLVTFSGDKLLGGPQAGLIVGKKKVLDAVKKNPLTRALRIDKMTLAALESTMRLYRDPKRAVREIPTLRMLTAPGAEIERRAEECKGLLEGIGDGRLSIQILNRPSRVGGGALPLQELDSRCLGLKIEGISANTLERRMRNSDPPVIGRIEDDRFLLDFRTIQDDELTLIAEAVGRLLERGNG